MMIDWSVTRTLGFKHYGRYVDDFYIVDTDRKRLTEVVPQVASMLASIGLSLHPNKTKIIPVTESINFLGAEVRPFYRHCSAQTMRKFTKCRHSYKRLCEFLEEGKTDSSIEPYDMHQIQSSINSYLGYLRHFKAAGISCDMLRNTYN